MKKTRLEKVPEELLEVINNAMKVRIVNNIDKVGKKWQNYPRFFRAISRDEEIRKKLHTAKFIDDEFGQFSQFNIFTFIVVSLLAVVLFAGLIYAQGLIYQVFLQVGLSNDANIPASYSMPCLDNASNTCTGTIYTNMTQAAQVTFGNVYQSILALRIVAVVYILCLAVSIILVNAMIKVNPLWFFLYILLALLAVLFAPQVSNAYYNLMQSGVFGGELNNFGLASWLVLNLPLLVMVIGIVGFIFLFINVIRTGFDTGVGL
jgi:hypothetical protein